MYLNTTQAIVRRTTTAGGTTFHTTADTAVVGTQLDFDMYWTGSEIGLRAFNTVDSAPAFSTAAQTAAIPLSALLSIGHLDGASVGAGAYETIITYASKDDAGF